MLQRFTFNHSWKSKERQKRGRPKKLVASVSIAAVDPEVAAIPGPAMLPPPPAQPPKSKRYARFETGWKSLRRCNGHILHQRQIFASCHELFSDCREEIVSH